MTAEAHPSAAPVAYLHPQFQLAAERNGKPLHRTKAKGDCAEFMAAAAFGVAGHIVSKPFSENSPYDLIVDDGSRRLARVQVKYARFKEAQGLVQFSCRRESLYVSGGYSAEDCDFFAAWCADLGTLYVIPQVLIGDTASPYLRTTPARNGQSSAVRLAADFVFDGSLPWPKVE